MATIKKAVG